jgi:hypothetical protein
MADPTQTLTVPAVTTGESRGLPGYPQSALLTRAHGLWLAARGGAEMPGLSLLDHPALEPLRPQLILFAIEPEPLDFRYLRIGSRILSLSNSDYTGRRLSEIAHQRPPSTVWDHLASAIDCRAPVKGVLPYVGRHRDISSIFHIVLPLAGNGEQADHLLVCVDLFQPVRRSGDPNSFPQLGL